jgi:DNA-binding NarL/FixJ family response regulator
MICCSGVETVRLHGLALLASAQLSRPVHLVLDAPWGFALWGLAQLPRPCLIVTQCPSPHYLRDLMDLQPEGILATSANPEDTLRGLQAVTQDQPFHKLPPLGPEILTARERQVMRLVALGLSDAEIARRLSVSKRTVYNWVSSLQDKLGLENRVEIALYYLGLLPHCRGWRGM